MKKQMPSSNAPVANALAPIIEAWGLQTVLEIAIESTRTREVYYAAADDTDPDDKVRATADAEFYAMLANMVELEFERYENSY